MLDRSAEVRLTGVLVCANAEQAALVREHLPLHAALTKAEQGCISFEVIETDDPLVWSVAEVFQDAATFRSHQARGAASDWGRLTAEIERRYVVDGIL